jgi:hypothetical protein
VGCPRTRRNSPSVMLMNGSSAAGDVWRLCGEGRLRVRQAFLMDSAAGTRDHGGCSE